MKSAVFPESFTIFPVNPLQQLNGNKIIITDFSSTDYDYMQQSLDLARYAENIGEVPIGAVLVANNEIIGKGYNCPISTNDPTAHAEIIALRDAAKKLNNYR